MRPFQVIMGLSQLGFSDWFTEMGPPESPDGRLTTDTPEGSDFTEPAGVSVAKPSAVVVSTTGSPPVSVISGVLLGTETSLELQWTSSRSCMRCTGLIRTLEPTLTSKVLITPSVPGNNRVTIPKGHLSRLLVSSSTNTTDPTIGWPLPWGPTHGGRLRRYSVDQMDQNLSKSNFLNWSLTAKCWEESGITFRGLPEK